MSYCSFNSFEQLTVCFWASAALHVNVVVSSNGMPAFSPAFLLAPRTLLWILKRESSTCSSCSSSKISSTVNQAAAAMPAKQPSAAAPTTRMLTPLANQGAQAACTSTVQLKQPTTAIVVAATAVTVDKCVTRYQQGNRWAYSETNGRIP